MKKHKKLWIFLFTIITIVFMLYMILSNKNMSPEEFLTEMEESIGDGFDIVYNEKSNQYQFTSTEDEFNKEIAELYISRTNAEGWTDLLYSYATYTEIIEEKTGKNIGIAIINPYEKEQTLAILRDGKIVFNFITVTD